MSDFVEFTLYRGRVKGKFFPGSHRYYVNNKPQTGVTTYISIVDKSRALVTWATELFRDHLLGLKNITEDDIYAGCVLHEERKQEAADIGTEAHKWIEAYVKGENPEMPERKGAQIAVTAFLEWVSLNKVKFLSSERFVYSQKHGYVGTLDIEAKVNGKLCLIDIKTSNGIYNTFGLQTAAYLMADQEESKRKYQGRWIIRLAKETEEEYLARMARKNAGRIRRGKEPIEIQPYQAFEAKFLDGDEKALKRDFEAFLAAKALYAWNRETDRFAA